MESKKNNKGLIILLVVIIILLSVLCVLLAKNIINFSSEKANNEIKDEYKEDNDVQVGNDSGQNNNEEKENGLELYKKFVGNGSGPFKWEGNEVINYNEVVSKMTDAYKKSFDNSDNGFSIPFKENGIWKSSGGFGTDKESVFKDIVVKSKDSCKIYYEITYTYTKMGDSSQKVYEDTSEFVVKTKACGSNDSDMDFSDGYKVDSFKLIYGLKFSDDDNDSIVDVKILSIDDVRINKDAPNEKLIIEGKMNLTYDSSKFVTSYITGYCVGEKGEKYSIHPGSGWIKYENTNNSFKLYNTITKSDVVYSDGSSKPANSINWDEVKIKSCVVEKFHGLTNDSKAITIDLNFEKLFK